MAVDLTERVQEIAAAHDIPESEVLQQALERGVEDLWQELVLARYLNEEIPRGEAVDLVGVDRIKRAERGAAAVEEDVRWGLNESEIHD
ncbi:hypothetical protein [Halospeciosus flavus]|uniref:Ribbon-helix-helix protein, copG family n=1 Tax=Halospeciosus flavus TaxID=3032283 RepID=A0ABD5Z6I6_9EURY|nr:hypothetical protein [Halospeciosus flavus]